MKTIIEPFRIRSVAPIRMSTRQERGRALEAAHYRQYVIPFLRAFTAKLKPL